MKILTLSGVTKGLRLQVEQHSIFTFERSNDDIHLGAMKVVRDHIGFFSFKIASLHSKVELHLEPFHSWSLGLCLVQTVLE